MIRDLRYIIKKVIIGLLIAIGVILFKESFMTASALSYSLDTLYLDNVGIYQEVWYERSINTGFNMKLIGVADTNIDTNLYAQILICAGPSNNSVIWVPGDQPNSWAGTQRNVTVNNTNVPCKVGTTSGKVQQVLFTTRAVDGDISATVRMSYKDGYTGFTFVSYGLSDKPWTYIQSVSDYNSAINNVSNAINNLNTSMQTLITSMSEEFTTEGNDRDTKAIEEWLDDFSSDTYGLTSVITAPLNTISSLTSSSCSALTVPIPFLDNESITLPCMSSIYSNTFGTAFTLYQTITTALIGYWCLVRMFAIK